MDSSATVLFVPCRPEAHFASQNVTPMTHVDPQ
jgi:hypothetical protein